MQTLIAPYLEEQGLRQGVIGPVVASYSVAALVFRGVTGLAYRRERVFLLVSAGCVIEAIGFVTVARTSDPWLLSSALALTGAGFAMASTGGLAAIMDVTSGRDAGSSMAWYTGCIGAGYGMAGFLGGWLGDKIGLSPALTAVAAIPLVAGLALGVGLRRISRNGNSDLSASGLGPPAGGLRAVVSATTPGVWLAALTALHINLLSGVLITFFPLYGLAVGLSLTQIGALTGFHSAAGSLVRFLAPPLFKRVHYRKVLPWAVIFGALAVCALTVSPAFFGLLTAWLGIGMSRGLLRVSSAALAADSSPADSRGASSAVYLAGLDIGKIIGPVVGGLGVEVLGYRLTFLTAGGAFPLLYFGLRHVVLKREGQSSP